MQTVQKPTNKFSLKPFSKGLRGAGVRVSGGDLCVAEAPTEPAGETRAPPAGGTLQPF